MSASPFSVETQLANKLRAYLIQNNFTIVQLVSPGGQCHFSLTYVVRDSLERRTCFPDLLSFSDEEIWVGEIKPFFSAEDKQKLVQIYESHNAETDLKQYLGRRYRLNFHNHRVVYNLIHSQEEAQPDDFCVQLIFSDEAVVILQSNT